MWYQEAARVAIIVGAIVAVVAAVLWKLTRRQKSAPSPTGCLRDGFALAWRHKLLLWIPLAVLGLNWAISETHTVSFTARMARQAQASGQAGPTYYERAFGSYGYLLPRWVRVCDEAVEGVNMAAAPVREPLASLAMLFGGLYLGYHLVRRGREDDSRAHRFTGRLCCAGFVFAWLMVVTFLLTEVILADLLSAAYGWSYPVIGLVSTVGSNLSVLLTGAFAWGVMVGFVFDVIEARSRDWQERFDSALKTMPALLVWSVIVEAPALLSDLATIPLGWSRTFLHESYISSQWIDFILQIRPADRALSVALLILLFWMPYLIAGTGKTFREAIKANFKIWSATGTSTLGAILLAAGVMFAVRFACTLVGAVPSFFDMVWGTVAHAVFFVIVAASAFLVPGMALFTHRALRSIEGEEEQAVEAGTHV